MNELEILCSIRDCGHQVRYGNDGEQCWMDVYNEGKALAGRFLTVRETGDLTMFFQRGIESGVWVELYRNDKSYQLTFINESDKRLEIVLPSLLAAN